MISKHLRHFHYNNHHSRLLWSSPIVSFHCKQISTSLFGERLLWSYRRRINGTFFLAEHWTAGYMLF